MKSPWTVDAALTAAQAHGLPRLDAQLLLCHQLQQPRSWLLAHGDETLTAAQRSAFAQACAALADGHPLAYLLGEREFHGLTLKVGPGVLVPRPDTETLVDWALALLADELADRPTPAVADLGTGSGAIALAVRHRCPRAQVSAVDASPQALAIARDNGHHLGLAIDWQAGDWWQPLAGRRFDLVLSNPPYIAEGDAHLPALRHEPREALVAALGGLADLHRLIDGAPAHLAPGGWLLLEHGWDQGEPVCARLKVTGFQAVQARHDLAGHHRCSGGRWPGPIQPVARPPQPT